MKWRTPFPMLRFVVWTGLSGRQIQYRCRAEKPAQGRWIVWQFPFSWYGLPGLMKKWRTRSLFTASRMAQRRNWAAKADPLLHNGSARGALYRRQFLGHTIEEYLIPFETTARLCNLNYWHQFIPAASATPIGMPTNRPAKKTCPGTRFKACRSVNTISE